MLTRGIVMIRQILRNTIFAVIAGLALAFTPVAAWAESWRQTETGTSTIRGTWDWDAARKLYNARWENGATAIIRVDSIDGSRAVMTRTDTGTPGFTARYVGTRRGNLLSHIFLKSLSQHPGDGSRLAGADDAAIHFHHGNYLGSRTGQKHLIRCVDVVTR